MVAHVGQLRGVDRARSPETPREQRQPAVAARQHLGDELDQPAPALIVELEHPIDSQSELIAALMRQGAPRRLLVAARRIGPDAQSGAGTGGYRQLPGKPIAEPTAPVRKPVERLEPVLAAA